MKIIIKHGKDRMNYFIKYPNHYYLLGYLSLQNATEQKKQMVKDIFEENREYILNNFIYALGMLKLIRIHEGIDYQNITKAIKNVLINGDGDGEIEQITRI